MIKIGKSPLSMHVVPLAGNLSPLRSYHLEVQDQMKLNIMYLLLKKVIQMGVRLTWSAEK